MFVCSTREEGTYKWKILLNRNDGVFFPQSVQYNKTNKKVVVVTDKKWLENFLRHEY